MAYPEPMNLDDIYGPGAEDADVLADEDEEDLETCEQCEREWPTSELSNGVCPACRIKPHYEARMRREERQRIVDGEYEISDADPGL